MILARCLRRAICRLLIGTLLFAQLAITAHACPLQMAQSSSPVAREDMDSATAALCVEHCRYGQQSVDHATAPAVVAALSSVLYPVPARVPSAAPIVAMSYGAVSSVALGADIARPHTILHCCLRF